MSKPTSGRVELAKKTGSCSRCSKTIRVGDKVVGRRFRHHAGCLLPRCEDA